MAVEETVRVAACQGVGCFRKFPQSGSQRVPTDGIPHVQIARGVTRAQVEVFCFLTGGGAGEVYPVVVVAQVVVVAHHHGGDAFYRHTPVGVLDAGQFDEFLAFVPRYAIGGGAVLQEPGAQLVLRIIVIVVALPRQSIADRIY